MWQTTGVRLETLKDDSQLFKQHINHQNVTSTDLTNRLLHLESEIKTITSNWINQKGTQATAWEMEEDLIMEGSHFLPNTMLSMSVPQNVPTMYFVNATPPQRSFSQHHVHNIDIST